MREFHSVRAGRTTSKRRGDRRIPLSKPNARPRIRARLLRTERWRQASRPRGAGRIPRSTRVVTAARRRTVEEMHEQARIALAQLRAMTNANLDQLVGQHIAASRSMPVQKAVGASGHPIALARRLHAVDRVMRFDPRRPRSA